MEHFTGFGLENFKVFKNKTNFDLAPLTILTGTNNSGKSTVINALKLLKENFKDFEEDEKEIYKNFDQLFVKNINSYSLIDRYGPLNQFVSNKTNKNEFKFSFRHKMIALDDVMEVTCTVNLYDKTLKGGVVSDIAIRSLGTDKEIFHVYFKEKFLEKEKKAGEKNKIEREKLKKRGGPYSFYERMTLNDSNEIEYPKNWKVDLCKIKINLGYFYNQFINRLKKNLDFREDQALVLRNEMSLDELNKKYNTAYYWSKQSEGNYIMMLRGKEPDGEPDFFVGSEIIFKEGKVVARSNLNDIVNELNQNRFFDFNFLLEKRSDQAKPFSEILTDYYKKNINKSLNLFNLDIIRFLSEMEWTSFSDSEDFGWSPLSTSDALSKERSIGQKDKDNYGFSLIRFLNSYCLGKTHHSARSGGIEIEEDKLESPINNYKSFYNDIFKPFSYLIIDKKEKDETKESDWESADISKSLEKSISEKTMYKMIYDNLNVISDFLNKVKDTEFLSANRVTPQRVYSLANKGLLSNKIKWIGNLDEDQNDDINVFLNKWVKEFEIGEQFIVKPDRDTANFKVYIEKEGRKVLFADLGRGATQLLQVILMVLPRFNADKEDAKFWGNKYTPQTITVEEPEANLHPALQSKLADMFAEAVNKFNIQLIIETHSEYLIRKLQYLTAKKEIEPDLSQIYYFYHPDDIPPGEEQVKKININKDGSLTEDFGTGFFDESDKMEMTVWNLNQSQKN